MLEWTQISRILLKKALAVPIKRQNMLESSLMYKQPNQRLVCLLNVRIGF